MFVALLATSVLYSNPPSYQRGKCGKVLLCTGLGQPGLSIIMLFQVSQGPLFLLSPDVISTSYT